MHHRGPAALVQRGLNGGRSFVAPPSALRAAPDPATLSMFRQALAVNGAWAALLWRVPKVPLTQPGLLHATLLLGTGLWTFLGPRGWFVCVVYLLLGSLVTKVKMQEKERLGVAEKRGGRRGPENVWGSAATAMVCAALTALLPAHSAALKVGDLTHILTLSSPSI